MMGIRQTQCDAHKSFYGELCPVCLMNERDALQKRVEELEKLSDAHKKLACLVDKQQQETLTSIRKAVKEIEAYRKTQIRQVAPDRWENTPLEVCLRECLDILRKHGLMEDK